MTKEAVETERNELRAWLQAVLDLGDFNSPAALSTAAGLYPSALYRLLNKEGGLGPENTDTLKKFLRKHAPPSKNGHSGSAKSSNGHAGDTANGGDGTASGHKNKRPVLAPDLAQKVVMKVLAMRTKTTDEKVRSSIDETLGRWGEEALEIICDSTEAVG